MSRAKKAALLADIGGTYARLAVLSEGVLGEIETYPVAQFATFHDLLIASRNRYGASLHVAEAFFAAAGPVDDGRAALTNSAWTLDVAELCSRHAFERAHLVNDFEATARGLPFLGPAHMFCVGGGEPDPTKPQVVLGPGTGFGMACRIPSSEGALILPTEGGHATVSSCSAREDDILRFLRAKLGHVSVERVLSGAGLENLYVALAALDGRDAPARSAAQITEAALANACDLCVAAVEQFLAFLGAVAGNAALGFGARGGVFIAGGVVPRLVDRVSRSDLRARFEAKGRFAAYLAPIALNIIVAPHCALLGLMSLAQEGAPGASRDRLTHRETLAPHD